MTGKNFSKLRFCNPSHVISELKFNFDLDIVSVFVCIVMKQMKKVRILDRNVL